MAQPPWANANREGVDDRKCSRIPPERPPGRARRSPAWPRRLRSNAPQLDMAALGFEEWLGAHGRPRGHRAPRTRGLVSRLKLASLRHRTPSSRMSTWRGPARSRQGAVRQAFVAGEPDRPAPELADLRPDRHRQKLDRLFARRVTGSVPRRPIRLHHRVPRLFDALALARGDGRHARLLKSHGARRAVDPGRLALATPTLEQGREDPEIVEDRHNRGSTIVTSQLPVDHWHEANRQSDYRRRHPRSIRK